MIKIQFTHRTRNLTKHVSAKSLFLALTLGSWTSGAFAQSSDFNEDCRLLKAAVDKVKEAYNEAVAATRECGHRRTEAYAARVRNGEDVYVERAYQNFCDAEREREAKATNDLQAANSHNFRCLRGEPKKK
jgi:hypothetical protein